MYVAEVRSQLFSITKLKKVFPINEFFIAAKTSIYFSPASNNFCCSSGLKDAAFTLTGHVSGTTGVWCP